MEEKLRREAKRESRRKEARERRQMTKTRAKKVWRGVAGAFGTREDGSQPQHAHSQDLSDTDQERTSPPASPTHSPSSSPAAPFSTSTYSVSSAGTFATLPRALPGIIHRWYASLRRAHLAAARQQAQERVDRIRELERNGNASPGRSGWGLGSFGWRIGREGETDQHPRRTVSGHRGDYEMYNRSDWRTRRRSIEQGRQHREDVDPEPPEDKSVPEEHLGGDFNPAFQAAPPQPKPTRPRSMWWWGPLSKWRLQDSTVY